MSEKSIYSDGFNYALEISDFIFSGKINLVAGVAALVSALYVILESTRDCKTEEDYLLHGVNTDKLLSLLEEYQDEMRST